MLRQLAFCRWFQTIKCLLQTYIEAIRLPARWILADGLSAWREP